MFFKCLIFLIVLPRGIFRNPIKSPWSSVFAKIAHNFKPLKLASNVYFSLNDSPSKTMKMVSISSKKLFSFSRYSNFCISVFPSFSPSAIALEVDRR